jgi:hypothetical protein
MLLRFFSIWGYGSEVIRLVFDNRRAEIAGQIFIYIVAIVVVGFIIVYGYSAIRSFKEKGEQVEFITLKSDIQAAIKSIASDYGSVKRPDISIPGKYTKVCFMDKSKKGQAGTEAICNSAQPDYYEPLVCEGWKLGRDSVFLVPDGSESFDAGSFAIEQNKGYLCIDVVNSRIKLQVTGLGDRAEIAEYG